MTRYATCDLFGSPSDTEERPSYGDDCPAFMRPAHHPEFKPYTRPKPRRSAGCPGAEPFDWRKGCKPYTLAAHAARLKGHPNAETWRGEYPDAPPRGQEACRASPSVAAAMLPACRVGYAGTMLENHLTPGTPMADRAKLATRGNKVQLSTLLPPETMELLSELHQARQEETDTPMSLASYVDYMIRQEGKRKGLGEGKTGRGSKRAK